MDKFSRSKSTREVVIMHPPNNINDLRSYSTSDFNYNPPRHTGLDYHNNYKEVKIRKDPSKSKTYNTGGSSSFSSSSKSWKILDPEMQRKKRVAGYKSYAVKGKMKGSLSKSFRWVKNTCNNVVNGFW